MQDRYLIGEWLIAIEYEETDVKKYLEKEMTYMLGEKRKYDYKIVINFTECKEGDELSARLRKIYVKKSPERIIVNLERKNIWKDIIFKTISPFFESRLQASLIDFFHNTFLGILETHLIENKKTLFHASGYIDKDDAILFLGSGQSGKSTIVRTLCKTHKIISEDYCILSTDGNVESLPIMTCTEPNWETMNFLEKINYMIVKYLEKKKPMRHVAFDEIYGIPAHRAKVKTIYVIERCEIKDSMIYIDKIEKDEFIHFFRDVMMNEMLNWRGYIHEGSYEERKMKEKLADFADECYEKYLIKKIIIPIINKPKELGKLVEEAIYDRTYNI